MLSYTRYPDLDFTLLISDGYTAIADWLRTVSEYREEGVTERELYDLRLQSNLFSNEEIKKILDIAAANISKHKGDRKTALVVESRPQFGLSRMYELLSEVEGVLTKTQVFYELDKAIGWLGQDVAKCFDKVDQTSGGDA